MNVSRKYIAAAIVSVSLIARGATVVVPVSEDTTLFELVPTSNLGASPLGAGAISQPSPATGAPARMHALMRFELVGVPVNATITSAELNVTVTRVPPVPVSSMFELRRVLKEWGEGKEMGTIGAPAIDGEATWLAPKHLGPAWSGEGASGADDVVAQISSAVEIDSFGAYTFPSTPELVADVQGWLANPGSNFGWMMKSDSENLAQSARRFANREAGAGAPTLTITYTAPAVELKILRFELRPAGMFLTWTGGTTPYQVARAEDITGPWTPVTGALNETQATAPAGVPTAFYRVVSMTP